MKNPDQMAALEEFLNRARRDLFPKLKSSALSVCILTGHVDAKLAMELGACILFNKPILILIQTGTPIHPRLEAAGRRMDRVRRHQKPHDAGKDGRRNSSRDEESGSMSVPALTRADLIDSRCSNPACNHQGCGLYLVAACHPHSAVDAHYDKTTGVLTMRCHRCKEFVAALAIAEKP